MPIRGNFSRNLKNEISARDIDVFIKEAQSNVINREMLAQLREEHRLDYLEFIHEPKNEDAVRHQSCEIQIPKCLLRPLRFDMDKAEEGRKNIFPFISNSARILHTIAAYEGKIRKLNKIIRESEQSLEESKCIFESRKAERFQRIQFLCQKLKEKSFSETLPKHYIAQKKKLNCLSFMKKRCAADFMAHEGTLQRLLAVKYIMCKISLTAITTPEILMDEVSSVEAQFPSQTDVNQIFDKIRDQPINILELDLEKERTIINSIFDVFPTLEAFIDQVSFMDQCNQHSIMSITSAQEYYSKFKLNAQQEYTTAKQKKEETSMKVAQILRQRAEEREFKAFQIRELKKYADMKVNLAELNAIMNADLSGFENKRRKSPETQDYLVDLNEIVSNLSEVVMATRSLCSSQFKVKLAKTDPIYFLDELNNMIMNVYDVISKCKPRTLLRSIKNVNINFRMQKMYGKNKFRNS